MTIEDAQRVFGYEHDTTNIQQGTEFIQIQHSGLVSSPEGNKYRDVQYDILYSKDDVIANTIGMLCAFNLGREAKRTLGTRRGNARAFGNGRKKGKYKEV